MVPYPISHVSSLTKWLPALEVRQIQEWVEDDMPQTGPRTLINLVVAQEASRCSSS